MGKPTSWLGIALVTGVGFLGIGGLIASLKGTAPDAAMIASITTLLGTIVGGLVGHEVGRRGSGPGDP